MLTAWSERPLRGVRNIYTGGMDVTVQREGETAPIVVAHLGASACLGEMALLLGCRLERRPPSLTACTPTHPCTHTLPFSRLLVVLLTVAVFAIAISL